MTNPYNFENSVAIKLLIEKDDEILLVREPDFNDWMPGRLGLPGGKPLLNETLQDAMDRKIETEVGLEVAVKGLIKVVNILMPQKNVYHFIVAADYVSGEIGERETESDDIRWYSREQITTMTNDSFTEYYNDQIIKDYLDQKLPILPMDIIQYQDNRSGDVAIWMDKGQKKS